MDCKARILFLVCCACFRHSTRASTLSGNTLWQGEKLNVEDIMFSDSGQYSLGFFKPSNNSNNLYLGINSVLFDYYIWVANRNTPIPADSRVALTIDENGNLKILFNGGSSSILLYSVEAPKNTSLSLTDTSNLVLREINSDGSIKGDILWQSSDYLTDTLFGGMKLGISKRTGQTWSLTSWRSPYEPATGALTFGVDPNNTKQLVIWLRETIVWTSGEWDSNEGSFRNLKGLIDFNFTYVSNENETYYRYFLVSFIKLLRVGVLTLYGSSGVSFSCNSNDQYPFHAGCKFPKPPQCRRIHQQYHVNDVLLPNFNGTGIMSMEGFKFDEGDNLTTSDCWMKCLYNCSCVAYSNTNVDATGCEIWSTTAKFTATTAGRQIYFFGVKSKAKSTRLIISSSAGGALGIFISCFICFILFTKYKAKVSRRTKQEKLILEIGGNATRTSAYDGGKMKIGSKDGKTNHGIHIFGFGIIAAATDNFSRENKLGEGGFGLVYKGKLIDGQEIAIKRLSQGSGQGLEEFKNEAQLIAKLQHRNLVRLLGFCIEREERILVYEYMPNKSLDFYFSGSKEKKVLNWKRRFCIIEGIAQGLVYLHNYSRLIVIHRDLKASNILLDDEMRPKISDFGMARTFKSKVFEEKTNRVVGTFGYMSPEYAMRGVVSIKTDVFSYGVLLLEIMSGKKNNNICYQNDGQYNLIGYAWQLWIERRASELIDPILEGSSNHTELLRCINIGLLCVQDKAIDRPTTLDVVSFLSTETIQLAQPKQPAFFNNNIVIVEQPGGLPVNHGSLNDVTISEMRGR
ncbi:putative Receptor protein kinase [Quillaja saponaria]|uniref:Receptor-like serine/threonine-protein kinase n=1 Tax=Quillaja saponaria TaxID=32244 RepID=A0AAD7M501_QUISA|nr:putative Receptor protein kinase [Quillaja saponaria]